MHLPQRIVLFAWLYLLHPVVSGETTTPLLTDSGYASWSTPATSATPPPPETVLSTSVVVATPSTEASSLFSTAINATAISTPNSVVSNTASSPMATLAPSTTEQTSTSVIWTMPSVLDTATETQSTHSLTHPGTSTNSDHATTALRPTQNQASKRGGLGALFFTLGICFSLLQLNG
ncbi:hypothetical protein FKW77_002587 [Venturia effusa]|uniref:Uncharacterized protein n=1 Tax=Venturia effusa TaxID=50376 RepID=A0A517LL72_9PEZI|nr:hypothetical protein FKW77_002587 [Venturia effusa]